ncbi:aldo/keto reductase [Vulcanisaeta souniana]|uniref:Aldo/keto reductase n=1 Tax=Vulcanisaeta souniana JCM 11219 TaxID=1293586 RepID=A0A830EBY2_9CREN|nr:aldo/keto reductase [Vulcanisaeta souniana]BDR91899.1 aldo/keto reductase [Vulcanisaeta souniana JCM 11219]GGI69494.1 aldo/keto reductase [Vulcanisaeta souniana JCM 11219]
MHHRALGRTGIRVSEISFGAWVIGTDMYGAHDRERDIALIRTALDLGINTFDTADMYGDGLSEKILGEALRGYDVNVFTKVGYEVGKLINGRHVQNFSVSYIINAVRESFNRLGRRITLLQLHNPPINVIRDKELHRALLRLVEEGYVEHLGVALGPETNVLNEGLAAIDEGYESIMFVFNVLEQEPGKSLMRRGVEESVGLITRVPHASNVLTSKQEINFGPSDHRNLRSRNWLVKALGFTNTRIKPIAQSLGMDLETLAIKYVLSYPVSTVMVTATNAEELMKYVGTADSDYLSDGVIKTLENLYEEFTKSISND